MLLHGSFFCFLMSSYKKKCYGSFRSHRELTVFICRWHAVTLKMSSFMSCEVLLSAAETLNWDERSAGADCQFAKRDTFKLIFFFLLERNCICVTQTCGMGFGRWWVLNTSCPGWRYKTLSKSRQLSSTNAWKINSTLINEKKMSEECSWHDPILDVKNNAITHC